MHTLYPHVKQDSQGMALVIVLLLTVVLFLLGNAALTNISTDFKTCYNYMQSLQALNSCEAGIAEGIARIKTNQIIAFDAWESAINTDLLNYQYMISYNSDRQVYRISSKGLDSAGFACKQIIAEYLSSFSPGDIKAPVQCGTGDFDGITPSIVGDECCPDWVDSTTDTHLPCVVTPADPNSPLDFEDQPGNLITDNPTKILYNSPLPDLDAMAQFYGKNPDHTSIPTAGAVTIGAPDDFDVVHIEGNKVISGNKAKTGYGVLVVTGDLIVTGQMIWYGLVIVLGDVISTGNGIHVTGAIMTPNYCQVRGASSIKWCSDVVKSALELGVPSPGIISWKEE
ncbi:MAG: PilX N-terminal domain-containing pilus assembly protein [bacterium]